jgi:hypothetical protein
VGAVIYLSNKGEKEPLQCDLQEKPFFQAEAATEINTKVCKNMEQQQQLGQRSTRVSE